jgi:hypothetical protein
MKKKTKLIRFNETGFNTGMLFIETELRNAKSMVRKFNEIKAMDNITDETFKEFIKDPNGYYNNN